LKRVDRSNFCIWSATTPRTKMYFSQGFHAPKKKTAEDCVQF